MTRTTSPTALDHLHAHGVAKLMRARAWPSVTLLLDTTPSEVMLPEDAGRLAALLRDAEQRLAEKQAGSTVLLNALRAMAADAARGPTGHGLVILVSQAVQQRYQLPAPVQARAMVEHTFATRDLVHTLHRTPPHLLLVVTPLCAQLYRGYADTLAPLEHPGFPVQHSLPVLGDLRAGADRLEEFLSRVDAELGRARRDHPMPLVVTGSALAVSALVRRGRNLERLAGVLTNAVDELPSDLYAATRVSLEEYLLSREEEALIAVDTARADDPASVAMGIKACWTSAHSRRPSLLVVEEGYRCPGVVEGGRIRLAPTRATIVGDLRDDPVDLRHDLVDDLIEVVIDHGGWVAFTRDGSLADSGRVTLVLDDGHRRPGRRRDDAGAA